MGNVRGDQKIIAHISIDNQPSSTLKMHRWVILFSSFFRFLSEPRIDSVCALLLIFAGQKNSKWHKGEKSILHTFLLIINELAVENCTDVQFYFF